MKKHTQKTILQIIPADGWRVVYRENDGTLFETPLAFWALREEVEADGKADRFISGLSGDDVGWMDFAEDAKNFVRYLGPGEDLESLPAEES